jgi:hypothetical protein
MIILTDSSCCLIENGQPAYGSGFENSSTKSFVQPLGLFCFMPFCFIDIEPLRVPSCSMNFQIDTIFKLMEHFYGIIKLCFVSTTPRLDK